MNKNAQTKNGTTRGHENPRARLFSIKRTHGHLCVAHCHAAQDGTQALTLVRITPDIGVVPQHDDLVGKTFSDLRELSAVLKERMAETSIHQPPDSRFLHQLLIAPVAMQSFILLVLKSGYPIREEGSECDLLISEAIPQGNGSLLIKLAKDGLATVESLLKPYQWTTRSNRESVVDPAQPPLPASENVKS